VTDRVVCLRCGQVVDIAATICPRCGASFGGATAPSGVPNFGGAPPSYLAGAPGTPMVGRSAPSHTLRNVLIFVAIAVVALVVLFVVPISHPFNDQLPVDSDFSNAHLLYFPTNSPVSLSWSATGGSAQVEVSLWATSGEIYAANGSSGSYAFNANGNPYAFEVSTESVAQISVNLQGSYAAPIL